MRPLATGRLSRAIAARERLAQLAAAAVETASPGEALRKLSELRRELETFERDQVARALAEGPNFATSAGDLGVSGQAAHRRFRDLAGDEPPLISTSRAPSRAAPPVPTRTAGVRDARAAARRAR